jgi:ArsR family transcriptional regulator
MRHSVTNRETVQVSLMKALADETRLRLVRLLFREELNVQELSRILQVPQPSVSRHLAVLKQNDLVNDRREGARIFYALNPPAAGSVALGAWLEEIGQSEHPDIERLGECLLQRAHSALRFADTQAANWDDISRSLYDNDAGMLAIAKLAPPSLSLVDLGTGTGSMLPCLSAMAAHVYAVDRSPQMLAQARQRSQALGLNNITFMQASIEELDGRLPPCDGMLLHFVLHQVASPGALLAHITRFIKADGRLVIVDRLPHNDEKVKTLYGSNWLGFSRRQIQEWLAAAGLQRIFWQEFAPGETHPAGTFLAQAGN